MTPIKLALCLGAAGIATLSSAPAKAEWESIKRYEHLGSQFQNPDRCRQTHDREAALRRSQGTVLRLPAGFQDRIEVFGHLIDMSPSAGIEGGSGSVQLYHKYSGFANNGRGCGAIGSVILTVNLPRDATGRRTFVVGSERITVDIVRPTLSALNWSSRTNTGRPTVSTPAPAPTSGPTPTPLPGRNPVTIVSGNCPPGSGCGSGTGSGVIVTGPSGSTAITPGGGVNLPDAMGSCIRQIGGDINFASRSMTVTLPRNRSGAGVRECLLRPLYIEADVTSAALHIDHDGSIGERDRKRAASYVPPTYGTYALLGGPTVLPIDRDFFRLTLLPAMVDSFRGERSYTISPLTSGGNPLTLIVRAPN
ncbi:MULTISPECIES: hypothetical protein [unclassified Sphingomonas]|uniref:hypothetical protein n=1 Tax=unclassified Sphingomonas TaxID=196159 RepID=UPI002151D8F9|nr:MULTISPECIES: hypothetical protein [unclassified Sphingomonas]MCR5871217.1 hypothetical protein [Sphingomonas sp. J344]UUY00473.1 hypothetical protein LRS08_05060 [Sphingomonas sp. J315]